MKAPILLIISLLFFSVSCNNNKTAMQQKIKMLEEAVKDDSITIENLKAESARIIDSLTTTKSNALGFKYYIITGSFKIENNADNFANDIANQGYKANIIVVDNGFRLVSAYASNSLGDVNQNLPDIQEKINPESWIYANR